MKTRDIPYRAPAIALLSLAVLWMVGCGGDRRYDMSRPRITISLLDEGRVLVDGEEAETASLAKKLQALKSDGGVVWYYRAPDHMEPSMSALEVIRLVEESKRTEECTAMTDDRS